MLDHIGLDVSYIKKAKEFSLETLPKDTIKEIEKYLPDSDKGRLASTHPAFYYSDLFIHTNTHCFYNRNIRKKTEKVQNFLLHVVHGEQYEVEEMLKQDLGLLLEDGIVKDYSNRKIKGTAFKIALGAGDTSMWKMVEEYFKQLPNGEEKKLKQFNEQFPESYNENEHEKYDFNTLLHIIKSDPLIHNQCQITDVTKHALRAFREHFTPKSTDIITTGKHFDMQILIDALEAYDANFDIKKKDQEWNQRVLYCQQVIGYLERLFPACDAQACCQGFYNVVHKEEPLIRCLQLMQSADYYYSANLGYSHYISSWENSGIRESCLDLTNRDLLKIYLNKKQQAWQKLRDTLSHKNQVACFQI